MDSWQVCVAGVLVVGLGYEACQVGEALPHPQQQERSVQVVEPAPFAASGVLSPSYLALRVSEPSRRPQAQQLVVLVATMGLMATSPYLAPMGPAPSGL